MTRNFGRKLTAVQPTTAVDPDQGHKLSSILNLQRTIGNRAVLGLVEEITVQRQPSRGGQPAPTISTPAIDTANDRLAVLREGILPMDFYRDPKVRALPFDERVVMVFKRKLEAIFKLGELKDQRAVPALVAVLDDTLWGTPKRGFTPSQKLMLQDAAAQSLGLIGGAVALAKLGDLLKSKDPRLRSLAGRALSGATGSQAVADLLSALKKEKDAAIKTQIITSLGSVGRSSSDQQKGMIVKELIAEIETSPLDTQLAVVNALGAIAHKGATEALLKLARQHLGIADLVSDIARALGEIRDPRAVELLAILLKDHGSKSVRSAAALALGKIRGSKAMAALRDSRSTEKEASVRADLSTAIHGKPAVLKWRFP